MRMPGTREPALTFASSKARKPSRTTSPSRYSTARSWTLALTGADAEAPRTSAIPILRRDPMSSLLSRAARIGIEHELGAGEESYVVAREHQDRALVGSRPRTEPTALPSKRKAAFPDEGGDRLPPR